MRKTHVAFLTMLSSPLVGPAPVGFLPPGGAGPFLPPPPLLPPQPLLGSFSPGLPLFPMPPPLGQNFIPPLTQHCVFGGQMNWKFQPAVTPQFPPARGQPRPSWKCNKRPRTSSAVAGVRNQSGSGSKPVLFVCAPCHKEYKSQQTYDMHLATHVKCSQCDFESSKGAMHDHELIHYLPPELNFTSQEDIRKWRKERRRNYPTAEVVLRKKQRQEQREERGDVADTLLYRYVSRVCGGGRGRSRQQHWVVGSNRKYTEQRGRGGWREREERESNRRPWRGGRGGKGGMRGRGGRRGRSYDPRKESGEGREGLKYVSARKPSLLEKLLATEMRVEQNALLQCVRHIVKSDFLGAGGSSLPARVREMKRSEKEEQS